MGSNKGHIVGNLGYQVSMVGGFQWLEVVFSLGSPATHNGIGVGSVASDGDRKTTLDRWAPVMSAALDSQSAFETAFNALPTLTTGPFPGVVPATWLASLSSTQRSDLRVLIRDKARGVLV